MPSSDNEHRIIRNRVFAVLFAFALVVAAFVLFLWMNNTRIEDQNMRYLQSSTEQSVRRIDEWMRDSQTELDLLASLYSSSVSSEKDVDIKDITRLGEATEFDYITFSDIKGKTYIASGGIENASDREYYQNGVEGKSGICSVDNSLFFGDLSVIFYTPLVIDGKTEGVLAGAYRENTMEKFLETYFVGVRTSTFLCLPNGNVMAYSFDDAQDSMRVDKGINFGTDVRSTLTSEDLAETISGDSSHSFTYKTDDGTGIGNAMKLPGYDLILIRTFPGSVTSAMQTRANVAGIILIALVSLALLALMAFLLLQSLRLRRKLQDESDYANEIIKSSLNLFQRFAVADLDKGTFSYLKEDEGRMIMPDGDSYDDFKNAWRDRLADPDDEIAIELEPERIRERLKDGVPYEQIEYRNIDPQTKKEHWSRGSIIALTRKSNGDVSTVLMAVSDITEMKKREIQNHIALERALREAERASLAKTDFLNSMSHDIRTPMNSIMGLTTIASVHIDDKDRVRDCLEKIASSSRHLLGLINEVLDMAKIESGKLDLSNEPFDLSETIESLLFIMASQINSKGLDLKVEIEDIEHEHLIGDPMRLQQVFVNIMGNSVKFTEKGGTIGLSIKELPSGVAGSGRYQFTFTDTGCGMSEEFLKTVFDPFTRANDSRVTKVEGTGLGMSIVQSVISMMDGTIDVQSELGVGTTFTVTVYMQLQTKEDDSFKAFEGLSILVADDDEPICESACEVIRSAGMKATPVFSGHEAVAAVREAHESGHKYDAVILDWKMPEMSGVDTARTIRETIDKDIPIIILSAYDRSAIEQEARQVGVDAFISKPLFRSRLKRVVLDVFSDENDGANENVKSLLDNDFSGKRVLLTEDNAMAAEIAQDILSMMGIDVDHAENGKRAVEMVLEAQPNHYDLVLMDIQMPIMNGYEASRAIREAAKGKGLEGETIEARPDLGEIPIIALTADAFTDDMAKAMSAGMNAHMSKPMEIDVLVETFKKWL